VALGLALAPPSPAEAPPAAGAEANATVGTPPLEPTETLTLARVIALARQRAGEVTAAQARRRAAEARLEEARGYRLPRVSLSEIWMRTDSPADVFGLQLNQERFSFQDFVATDPNDPDPLTNATTRLEIQLPVYTGGELSARIRQAELASEAASSGAHRVGDEAAFAAAESYVHVAQAREQVALLERSLATVTAHVQFARAYVEQGMLVASELLRAEVERARLTDLLTTARGQARVAEAALAFRLSLDQGSHWELAPLPDPVPLAGGQERGSEAGLETWLAGAESRIDLIAARQMEEVAHLEIDVRRALRRPRIGLLGRYDFADEALFGTGGNNAAVMAVASLDLFAGGSHRAAAAAAEADAAAATADVARFAEGVRLEIRQAYEEAASARARHSTAGAAVEAATENERIVEARFRQGVVRTIDLLDATTARREAETRELVARTDAHLAALRLALAAGRAPESALSQSPGVLTP
jgi:outer membrane protein TolC